MKSFVFAVAAASVLAAPIVSFAQTDSSLTRAQVRADLVQLEAAGYMPSSGDGQTYPENIQAAQANLSASGAETGYGGAAGGASASGGGTGFKPVSAAELRKMYSGGQR
jgi:hypothetical protein